MALAKEPLHYLLLLFICCSLADAAAKLSTTAPCLPDQASSLLQLKSSFIDANISSWRAGTDCCHWEGVTCDAAFGRVISLDLGGLDLMSRRLDPALFNLTSLRKLSLAFIDFSYALLPAFGFERLTDLIHLNLSDTHFMGQIPIGMACLKNLVTLDLSYNYELYFEQPSFQTFMANMINLRELYLDEVDLSSGGSTWSTVLADSVPQLQILSLVHCGISGSIHPSFSRLRSLTSINLGYNSELTGKVPEYFSELSSLTSLDISFCNFQGQFPTKIFQLKSLRTLRLYGNLMLSVRLTYFPVGNNLETLNLEGTNFSYDTPSSFANLQSLKELGLNTMGIGNELPSLISKLPSLDDLLLRGPDLKKLVLSWLGNFTQLTSLELDGYDFSKSVPTWIGKLTSLERLTMRDCNFLVPIPYQIGNLTKLTSLVIYNCNFSGPIPSTIGNLIQLEELVLLSSNFSGKIPRSLFSLPALQVIYLIDNQLVGSLEDIPAPLSSPLREIDLRQNQLTGPIPKSFFQLTNLTYLNLESNQLTDTIELGSVWRLKSLNLLSLGNNMISLIEKEGDTILSPSPKIRYLYLASCNLTKLPTAFKYLDNIQGLDLSNNQIKGTIPSWVWEKRLQTVDLSHNMFTTLEKLSLVQMTYFRFLDLSFNRLQGTIPIPLTSSKLFVLDYSNNDFSSIEPNFGRHISNVMYINLSKNRLSGDIPISVCSLKNIKIMDLSYNYFSGPVPSCLMERLNLTILKLRENKLQGMLPESIREGCNLQTIDLNGNQIEGVLPRSLANCQDLEVLDVGNNQIVGLFPSWLGTLPKLQILVLRSNKLNGTIKGLQNGDQHFTSLQIIDLASNHLSGNLHSEWFENLRAMMNNSNDEGQILEHQTNISYILVYQDTVTITYKYATFSITRIQTAFKIIDLSNNSFEGSIPDSIGKLVSLRGLNMSHNNFTGHIPSQLGNLTRLESMDLSCNYLSGEIPKEFTYLTSLSWLNLSYNNLTGRIPQGNQLLSFSNNSFEGNDGLCGIQISKVCDTLDPDSTMPRVLAPEPNTLRQDRLDAIILFIFAGLGFGVGFALVIIFRPFRHIEGWICKHMEC